MPLFNQELWEFARPAALGGAAMYLGLLLALLALWWRLRMLWPLSLAAVAVAFLPFVLYPEFLPLAFLASDLAPWIGSALFLVVPGLAALFVLTMRGGHRWRDLPSFLVGQVLVISAVWLAMGPWTAGVTLFGGAEALAALLPLLLLLGCALPRWRSQPGGGALLAGSGLLSLGGLVLLLALLGFAGGKLFESLYLLANLAGLLVLAAAPVQVAGVAQALAGENRSLREETAALESENRELSLAAARLENEKSALLERRRLLEAEKREAELRLGELTETADAFFKLRESIDYARRIQQALVPSEGQLRETMGGESFILNLPRDNVSGDFLWCGRFADGWTMLCVADCTGHGVPGAFMSALGTMLLGQIVTERNVRRPDQVLFAMDRNLRGALARNGAALDDGMEAAVLLMSPDRRQALFSGARLGLHRVLGNEVTLLDGVKRPIGGKERPKMPQFEPRHIALRTGEMLFLASDGFQDQLGGPEGRRFLSKRFRDTLGWTAGLPVAQQGESLRKVLSNWRGERPQTDDVLVVGLKV